MGNDKTVKSDFKSLKSSDKVREMMIAAANYNADVSLCSVQEILVDANSTSSKKRRLNHLSPEEKIRRKKLKNREAAQTSRDRKKAYVTSLEEAVKLLQQENKLLSERVSLLEDENKKLRQSDTWSRDAAGPAVSSDPPQQGTPRLKERVLSRHKVVTVLALMTALTYWTGCPRTSDLTSRRSRQGTTSLKISQISSLLNSSLSPSLRKRLERKWWGPGGGKRAWKPPPIQC